jgi:general stress protein YciG
MIETMAKRLSMEFFRKMGKKGGKKSGAARLEKLTPEQRSEIARKAAAARWGKNKSHSTKEK